MQREWCFCWRTAARCADWPAVEARLQPWLDSASVVLTSRDVHFLHFFGDYDVAISSNGLSVIGGDDFDLDPRTGRPVIASTDALARIIDCFPTGLIAIDVSAWRSPVVVPDEVADVIEAQTVEIDLPPEPGVRAFRWEHPVPDSLPADCATLPQIKERQALVTGPSHG